MSSSAGASAQRIGATWVQKAALIVGIVFLVVGVLGFIPGITTNYDQLMLAGHDSDSLLLGVFQVSVLHNIVHFAFGVVGIGVARSFAGSRGYLIIGGIIYLILFIYGVVIDLDSALNFVPLNVADNILHIVLAIGMVALGLILGRRAPARRAAAA